MKNYNLYQSTKNKEQKDDQISNINNFISSSLTTTTNNVIKTTNNYFYSTYKSPKKNILAFQQTKNNKQNLPNNDGIPNINIYSKGKIKKSIGNTNNIIINNNTNIINNNNTNIINNNFINSNINNKDYIKSIKQLNIEQINELKNNKVEFINNIIREKPLLINKNKINQKNYIHTKNNNLNKNYINNNIITESNISSNKLDENINKINYNLTETNVINNINKKNSTEENSAILNVEEILMIEEKLSSLMNCLIDFNPCKEECFECLDFYFTTKLSRNICNYFLTEKYLKIIKKAMNLKLFSFILCYDISLNEDIFPQYIVLLDELFGLIHTILILISKYFCNKIRENSQNIWVNKLQNLIKNYYPEKRATNEIFEEIEILCNKLTENLFPLILKKYNKIKISEIYNKINILSQDDLQRLFLDKIFINMNLNGSIIASSSYFKENKNIINDFVPIPYLKNLSNKKYTLILDLDETLIHFKGHPNDDSSGILQFRPFLSEFLSAVENFYELVVFTAATQDYADPIINAIEQKGTKFDYRLYRIHTIIINNDFVKDLSRLGRDLSRTIIVDNMEQNYKLQPENGITIRPFWGKDINDMALYDLITILIQIAKNNMDVRDGIKLYKEDIISRVTSNIFRRVQY